eukprot:6306738-Amphidinium_carterae.1
MKKRESMSQQEITYDGQKKVWCLDLNCLDLNLEVEQYSSALRVQEKQYLKSLNSAPHSWVMLSSVNRLDSYGKSVRLHPNRDEPNQKLNTTNSAMCGAILHDVSARAQGHRPPTHHHRLIVQ